MIGLNLVIILPCLLPCGGPSLGAAYAIEASLCSVTASEVRWFESTHAAPQGGHHRGIGRAI